jgi:hypothetical protein
LVAYLIYRNDNLSKGILFQTFHGGGLAIQCLLMLPTAIELVGSFGVKKAVIADFFDSIASA